MRKTARKELLSCRPQVRFLPGAPEMSGTYPHTGVSAFSFALRLRYLFSFFFPWFASWRATASVSVRRAFAVMPGTASRQRPERSQPHAGAARKRASGPLSPRPSHIHKTRQKVLAPDRAHASRRVLPAGGTPALLGDPKFFQNFFGLFRWKTGRLCRATPAVVCERHAWRTHARPVHAGNSSSSAAQWAVRVRPDGGAHV